MEVQERNDAHQEQTSADGEEPNACRFLSPSKKIDAGNIRADANKT
jgi:hypothetical protein